jgi:oxygen-independent coproporphyrinogen-3 oxidase
VQPRELLIRELVLQLKTGRLETAYFQAKFGTDILAEFESAFARHRDNGNLTMTGSEVTLTRQGLLQVDRLLPEFFLPEHRGARYT